MQLLCFNHFWYISIKCLVWGWSLGDKELKVQFDPLRYSINVCSSCDSLQRSRWVILALCSPVLHSIKQTVQLHEASISSFVKSELRLWRTQCDTCRSLLVLASVDGRDPLFTHLKPAFATEKKRAQALVLFRIETVYFLAGEEQTAGSCDAHGEKIHLEDTLCSCSSMTVPQDLYSIISSQWESDNYNCFH